VKETLFIHTVRTFVTTADKT